MLIFKFDVNYVEERKQIRVYLLRITTIIECLLNVFNNNKKKKEEES